MAQEPEPTPVPDSGASPSPVRPAEPAVAPAVADTAELPPVKKSILPKLALGALLSLALMGVFLGLIYWKGKGRAVDKTKTTAHPANTSEPGTQAKPKDNDAYGDWVPPGMREPSPAAPVGVSQPTPLASASQSGPAPLVATEPTKKESEKRVKESVEGGEFRTPEIRNPEATASADSDSDYGATGDGYSSSGGNAAASGRPLAAPKEKDVKPEQYFADIVPLTKRPATSKRTQNQQTAVRAGAPAIGKVLGGPNSDAPRPEAFAPAGRVIPCELVFSVDSTAGSAGGNIIGQTTEDLVFEDKVIVPKGSEVHGKVGTAIFESDKEGRIFDNGTWRFVLPRQPGLPAGRELSVRASAHLRKPLVTEPSGRVRQWDRELDGRPGLPGKVVSMRDKAKWKSLGMSALGALAKGSLSTLKDERSSGGLVGGYEDTPTMKNVGIDAASSATESATNSVAQSYEEQANRLAEYVMVDSGTQFYLIVEDTLLPGDAVAGRKPVAAQVNQGRPQSQTAQPSPTLN